MKNLQESLLDDEDVLMDKTGPKLLIENFIKKNYEIRGKIYFDESKKDIVNFEGRNIYLNENAKSLTNGLFKWGTIKGSFYCFDCKKLSSLEGCPEYVTSSFIIQDCPKVKSIDNLPKRVDGIFGFSDNGISISEREIISRCKTNSDSIIN